MTEVLFYHLTDSKLEQALPPLLEKSMERGWRAVVQAGSEERLDVLDTHLWTWRDDSFIGHGLESDPHAAEQPVVLTLSDRNPNGAQIRFLVDGADVPPLESYERAVMMFDGHDAAEVAAARERWKDLKAAGHALTYWQQVDGRWERKA